MPVKSSVMVGSGVDAEIISTLDDDDNEARIVLASKLMDLSNAGSVLDVDPDIIMDMAAEVVLAMVMAAGGSG